MELKFGKIGAIISSSILFSALATVGFCANELYQTTTFFPFGLLLLIALVLVYFFLKPSFLNYFVLCFSSEKIMQFSRPFYPFQFIDNAPNKLDIDLKKLEKVLIVIPERTYLPANYLFFEKGNNGRAFLLLTFDEKEGKAVKKQFKKHQVKHRQVKIQDINYDAMVGLNTKI